MFCNKDIGMPTDIRAKEFELIKKEIDKYFPDFEYAADIKYLSYYIISKNNFFPEEIYKKLNEISAAFGYSLIYLYDADFDNTYCLNRKEIYNGLMSSYMHNKNRYKSHVSSLSSKKLNQSLQFGIMDFYRDTNDIYIYEKFIKKSTSDVILKEWLAYENNVAKIKDRMKDLINNNNLEMIRKILEYSKYKFLNSNDFFVYSYQLFYNCINYISLNANGHSTVKKILSHIYDEINIPDLFYVSEDSALRPNKRVFFQTCKKYISKKQMNEIKEYIIKENKNRDIQYFNEVFKEHMSE